MSCVECEKLRVEIWKLQRDIFAYKQAIVDVKWNYPEEEWAAEILDRVREIRASDPEWLRGVGA